MPLNNRLDENLMPHPYFRASKRKNYTVCPPYCDCDFPKNVALRGYRDSIPDLIKCRCGEDDPLTHSLNWTWEESPSANVIINGPNVSFHPTYSQGTAIVRGQQPLAAGMLHFWEIRTLTALSGTDVMFGIGTGNVDLEEYKFHFVSALGVNNQSWGLSYEGKIYHGGKQMPYSQRFSQGCIVGVLLDRVRGRLEFFLNRRSLGVAYYNIPTDPKIKLYPMVSSTAAKSCIRLMNSTSQKECLQLQAFRALAKQPKGLEELKQMPGLKNILNKYWFLAPPVRYSRANEFDILDEAVLSSKSKSRRRHKNRREGDAADTIDLDSNAQAEVDFREYFDEFLRMMF